MKMLTKLRLELIKDAMCVVLRAIIPSMCPWVMWLLRKLRRSTSLSKLRAKKKVLTVFHMKNWSLQSVSSARIRNRTTIRQTVTMNFKRNEPSAPVSPTVPWDSKSSRVTWFRILISQRGPATTTHQRTSQRAAPPAEVVQHQIMRRRGHRSKRSKSCLKSNLASNKLLLSNSHCQCLIVRSKAHPSGRLRLFKCSNSLVSFLHLSSIIMDPAWAWYNQHQAERTANHQCRQRAVDDPIRPQRIISK